LAIAAEISVDALLQRIVENCRLVAGARVAAMLRRTAGSHLPEAESVVHYPGSTIDLERKIVLAGLEEVRLSRTERCLVSQQARISGRVLMHTELLSRIWRPECRNETQ